MSAGIAVQDPRSSIQAIMDENERLKTQLASALETQEQMKEETKEARETLGKLRPYLDIIENTEDQRYMQVTIRDNYTIGQLKIRAKQLFGDHQNVDSESKEIAKDSRSKVDQLVEVMVSLGCHGLWPYVVNDIRKRQE